jgi:hypothetical protein
MGTVAIRRIAGAFTPTEIKTHGIPHLDRLRLELGPLVGVIAEGLAGRAPTGAPKILHARFEVDLVIVPAGNFWLGDYALPLREPGSYV